MIKQSDTPRTDAMFAALDQDCESPDEWEGWTFARTLERELATATRERDEARIKIADLVENGERLKRLADAAVRDAADMAEVERERWRVRDVADRARVAGAGAAAMTRDEIISMAREAGARVFGEKIVIADNASSGDGSRFVYRFATLVDALVAAREREACAELVEEGACACCWSDEARALAEEVAEAIRAGADNEEAK